MTIKTITGTHFIILSTLFLTACMGVYEEDFDCGVGKGVGCKSISEVNEMVNRGQVPLTETAEEEKQNTDGSTDQEAHLKIDSLLELGPLSAQSGIKVKRIPEKTLRLWVTPHEAEDGSFVEETYVNLVLSPGRWVNVIQSSVLQDNVSQGSVPQDSVSQGDH